MKKTAIILSTILLFSGSCCQVAKKINHTENDSKVAIETTNINNTILKDMNPVLEPTRKDSLIVFIGEKIEVNYVERPPIEEKIEGNDTIIFIRRDNEYRAKYKIIQLVHGSYKPDTIEFAVFDHYGEPPFSQHQTVLLFVSDYNGKLYHEKYQYFDLYMAENDEWASPYSSINYDHPFKNSITVKPEKIKFKNRVSFPIDKLTKKDIEWRYPSPYYEIRNGQAIAIYGNYVDDLFKLKQQTVLKARGIY
jgi:hypothetical protein